MEGAENLDRPEQGMSRIVEWNIYVRVLFSDSFIFFNLASKWNICLPHLRAPYPPQVPSIHISPWDPAPGWPVSRYPVSRMRKQRLREVKAVTEIGTFRAEPRFRIMSPGPP